jgi:hypothetical protein
VEDIEDFFGGLFIGDRQEDACGHDFAFEGPIVEVFDIAAEDAEDEFDADVFEGGEVEQGFCDSGFREEVCFDEDEEDFSPELGNVLENGAQVSFFDHGGDVRGLLGVLKS